MTTGRSSKRTIEAQREGESSPKRQNVTMGMDVLDCTVCSQPLRRPIYQCSVEHFICSCCHGKLLDMKCHICSAKTSFQRCYGMEHVVESSMVSCSNVKHGCGEKIVYYQKKEHEKTCPKGPCFCPESGCGITGPIGMLLHHFITKHKYPLTFFDGSDPVHEYLSLQPGLHVLLSRENCHFFLFNMASQPFGHAISVVCVQPNVTEPEFTCDMYYDCPMTGNSQSSCCKIKSSSLSDGLPTGYDLILPKGKVSDDGNGIKLRTTIRGKVKKVFYNSDSDLDEAPISYRYQRLRGKA